MFEEEVDEMAVNNAKKKYGLEGSICMNIQECAYVNGFQQGAEFGYNKANEWHDIKEIEPSKEQLGKQLLIKIESVTGDTDYDYFVYKYKGESISDVIGVIAWKEIVLPELPKESE